MRLKISLFFLIVSLGVIVGCQTTPRPLEEYTFARTALEAARSAEAAKHSPGFWSQAEEAYTQGQKYYTDREWDNARKFFIISRKNAEKAENSARLKRAKSGDIL